MVLKGRAIPVNLVNDALHWRLRHHVEDVYESIRFCRADTFGGSLREPVEFRDLIIEQREYGKPPIRPRRTGRVPVRWRCHVQRREIRKTQSGFLR